MTTKILGPNGVGTTIWFDVKLAVGDKVSSKYHGMPDGLTVFGVVIVGDTKYVMVS